MQDCIDMYAPAAARRIAEALIDKGLAHGWTISVYDGCEWTLRKSTDRAAIRSALATTDCDTLRFRDAAGEKVGIVVLIWGNDCDVISDYSDNAATGELVDAVLAASGVA